MYLASGIPGGGGPIVTGLTESASGVWTGSVQAPTTSGMYHFTVGIFSGGRRTVVDNDAWNIQVVAAATSTPASAAQPLPADIPLVPPYSYLNPVPADFQADGTTVHGSEVSTNARPDVGASAVATFYENHLPRAGWSIEGSSVPEGATSFSIVATKAGADGTRVCIVQYGGGVVHIFYGTE